MSLDYEMNGIFPTPIYFAKLIKFTDMELKVIRLMEKQSTRNMGNSRSDDTFVLKSKHFENIKKQLMKHVRQYFDKVICTSDKIVPYITQSWINYTREGEYHHSHAHPNSLISGVLYIDANKDNDKILFEKRNYHRISLTIKDYNLYNSDSWFFPVQTGDLIIFPSETQHKVEYKKGNNVRTSLSFNVFVKGDLGNLRDGTPLTIGDSTQLMGLDI
tara:strand:+ start:432 stop:1079 length:648 start_codon:yes stop_codon:yes gene_type:complete